ncbi:MAG: hypothetical protein KBF97_03405 [Bacteroidetes bacterium]|nr:hypothetical protein [Bacteroidota bacterium]
MYEKLLSEAEKYLESHKTKEVPILELWDEMAERSEQLKFDMPENLGDFEFLIEADKRFIFVAAKIEDEIEDVDVGEEEGEYEVGEDFFEVEKMEKLGFNQDQVVGLKKYEKKKRSDDDDDDEVVHHSPAAQVRTAARAAVPSPHAADKKISAADKKKQNGSAAKSMKTKSKIAKSTKGKK